MAPSSKWTGRDPFKVKMLGSIPAGAINELVCLVPQVNQSYDISPLAVLEGEKQTVIWCRRKSNTFIVIKGNGLLIQGEMWSKVLWEPGHG